MPSEIIFCRDYPTKKEEIEENGAFEVISCEPLPNQESEHEEERRCKIVWKIKPI
ncbi:hypothetical protein [Vibrio sp. RE88]|uniref:hypothetical protein n=1 Tax=Vibrio sp. RE88 TaxID=2607610 RepID=UPI00149367E6|nr:hypothetical protein [Vibrio sp. RE88]